jgi:hypothetical protein
MKKIYAGTFAIFHHLPLLASLYADIVKLRIFHFGVFAAFPNPFLSFTRKPDEGCPGS